MYLVTKKYASNINMMQQSRDASDLLMCSGFEINPPWVGGGGGGGHSNITQLLGWGGFKS